MERENTKHEQFKIDKEKQKMRLKTIS